MQKVYGAAYGNANLAKRIYDEQNPRRHIPFHITFLRLDQRLRGSGQFQVKKGDSGRNRNIRTLIFESEVLQRFENNPRISTRAVTHSMGTSHMSAGMESLKYLGIVGVNPQLQFHEPPPVQDEDPSVTAARALCSSLPGLVAQQVEVCLQHPGAIRSVSDGARRGIQECQHQFRYERWNCTTHDDEQSVFGYVLERGSKETAFIYAVTSAGVVHAVTQACSSGNLTDCSCDDSTTKGQETPEGWKWGGCSDNLNYGVQFARKFVDAPEKVKPAPDTKNKKAWSVRTKMNLHNNEAGRQVVASLMRMQCRCHGVSGSCEVKTCWRTMPSFNEIGDTLKRKYRQAVQVPPKFRKRLRRKSKTKRRLPAGKGDLVHIHKSPNYCVHDPAKGILGTSGRICNKTSHGPDSCDLLCCGRGYNTQVIKYVERCQCKFVWCCVVRCKNCETQIDRHTCK